MLILLALPVIIGVAALHRYLQCCAPTNLLTRRVRAQEPRWRIVAALIVVAAVLLIAMHALSEAVASGAPGWLNLLVLVLAWDAIKMAVLAMTQAVGCIWWSAARHAGGRTYVRRRAFRSDAPAPLSLCP
jgi:hypothetical protein